MRLGNQTIARPLSKKRNASKLYAMSAALCISHLGEVPGAIKGSCERTTESYRMCASPLRCPLNPTAIGVTRASVSNGLTVQHAGAGPAFVYHLVLGQNTTCIAYTYKGLLSVHTQHLNLPAQCKSVEAAAEGQ